MTDRLGAVVREKWSPLLLQDFTIQAEEPGRVVLGSADVQVVVVHDPRGEVEVYVQLKGGDWPVRWSYSGVVGTASLGRLLEIALAEMRAEPKILSGDPDYFEKLGGKNAAESHALTEYAAGRGPRPGNRHLP